MNANIFQASGKKRRLNMLLGFWLARIGFFQYPIRFKGLIKKWMIVGMTFGIAASIGFWSLNIGKLELSPSLVCLVFVIIGGMLRQSLFYIGSFVQIFPTQIGQKIGSIFEPIGRMALSNYLLQTLFYLCFFFHWTPDMDLYGTLGITVAYGLAIVFFALQVLFSRWWLKHHKQGPVENWWKKWSYRQISLPSQALTTVLISIGLLSCIQLNAQNKFELISISSDEEQLEAVMVYPNSSFTGPRPCLLFLPGSGPNSVTPYAGKGWAFQGHYLEEIFLKRGYIIVYLNKRGLGASTGDWRKNDFYGRAKDASNARNYLKTLPIIDSTQIGLSGHSQGGWISQIVAAQHQDVAFVISFAGPTVGVIDQDLHTEAINWKCKGFSKEKIKRKIKKKKKWYRISAKIGRIFPFIKEARYWFLIKDYQHDEVLKNLSCKTLLLFGEYDSMVPPKENIDHLKTLFNNEIPPKFSYFYYAKGQSCFFNSP